MTGSEVAVGAATALIALALLLTTVAVFGVVIHWSWVAKEWLVARMEVPYATRQPWHVRAWKRWLR